MRLIDADALMQATCDEGICSDCEDAYEGQNIHANCSEIRLVFLRTINDAPTIDIDRPKGKWIEMYRNGFGNMICMCSKCSFHALRSHYCHNCGADMRKREDK